MLAKSKTFREEKKNLRPTTGKLTGWMTSDTEPVTIREESDEEDGVAFQDIPAAPGIEIDDEDDHDVLIDPVGGDDETSTRRGKPLERDSDDKKKLAFNTSYDGFSIYGKIICLIVKRRGRTASDIASTSAKSGQATMEDWIVSTQMPQDDEEDAA